MDCCSPLLQLVGTFLPMWKLCQMWFFAAAKGSVLWRYFGFDSVCFCVLVALFSHPNQEAWSRAGGGRAPSEKPEGLETKMAVLTRSYVMRAFKRVWFWSAEGNKYCNGETFWEPTSFPWAAPTVEGQRQMPHLCGSWVKFPRRLFPTVSFSVPSPESKMPLSAQQSPAIKQPCLCCWGLRSRHQTSWRAELPPLLPPVLLLYCQSRNRSSLSSIPGFSLDPG